MKWVLIIGVAILILIIGAFAIGYSINKNNSKENNNNSEQNTLELSCKSKVDCASITNLRVPYHGCSLNNGCEMKDEKCFSVCEGKDKVECISTTISSINPDSINPDEVICEWK